MIWPRFAFLVLVACLVPAAAPGTGDGLAGFAPLSAARERAVEAAFAAIPSPDGPATGTATSPPSPTRPAPNATTSSPSSLPRSGRSTASKTW